MLRQIRKLFIGMAAIMAIAGIMWFIQTFHKVKAVSEPLNASLQMKTYTSLQTVEIDKSTVQKTNNGDPEALSAAYSNGGSEISGHKLMAENSTFELYFREESVSVIIRNKETGAIMESILDEDDGKSNALWQAFMKSGVVVRVIKANNVTPSNLNVSEATKKFQYTENGVWVDLYFDSCAIGLQVRFELDEKGFTVEIPDDSIVEEDPTYTIGEIYLLPFLGYTYLGEREGYMFIPDGNGALIYLEDNEGRYSSSYSQYVYGSNIGVEESYKLSLLWDSYQTVNEADKIVAPVFGMVHRDSEMAYLGIIESGDAAAKIEAYPNGAYTDYNWITSKFILRQVYVQPTSNAAGSITMLQEERNHFDMKVRYNFVFDEEADYVGLAKNYREYLLSKEVLSAKEDGFKLRMNFLGTDKEDFLVFKKTVAMTTVDNIRTIFSELHEEGVTDLLAIYDGWQKGGVNAFPVTSYKADKAIGGTDSLTSLIEDSRKSGIDFYLAGDGLRVNPDMSNGNFNVAKRITKKVYEEQTYQNVFSKFRYLIPSKSKSNLLKVGEAFAKENIDLCLDGVTNHVFTYYDSGVIYDREAAKSQYIDMVASLDESVDMILVEPFAYLWKYADAYINMPVGSSDYIFTDEEVPFFTIVLKGSLPMYSDYVNFEANKNEFFLQLVEMGVNPSFYITYESSANLQNTNSSNIYSSQYSVYKETMIEYYTQLKEVFDQINGAHIMNHEKYDQVSVVTYDNGVKIYVNYSDDTTYKIDGLEIEPMSYKVGE